jgi:hypothetical protein
MKKSLVPPSITRSTIIRCEATNGPTRSDHRVFHRSDISTPPTSVDRVFLLSDVSALGHSFLSSPDFLWAHRSGNSSPLRPTRLLLYRFRPQQHRVPSNKADASLRLHAPSLSVVPQRKRGRKKGKNKMSYLYVKWNSFRCGSLANDSVIRAWFVFAGHSRNGGLRRHRRRV